ncbi:histidine kinase [Nocardioides immobilis]|uniref:Histidine kinase n=1 Tax=Nocardioides immobilis TaxID=2049295 RepID=A0A417Y310_9ACTN|nr:histidine kinase [Nocardioides immobilis]
MQRDVTGTSVRAVVAVENRMFRALAVLRVVVLVNAVVLAAYRNNFEHPVAGWLCVAVMVVWTVHATVTYAKPIRRTVRLMVADLGIAVGLLVATPFVKGEWFNATIPGFWIMGALLAWAIRYGWRGGLIASVILGGTDRLIRADFDQGNYGYVFLIVLGGPIVGYLVESLQQMAAERDLAEREAAAATERARLARVVHDGVLQVLALVQRRGAELGGEAAELGRLAGEQERALRTLIRAQDRVTAADRPDTEDLATALGSFAPRPGLEVVLPGGPVELPASVVAELVAVVGACLDNVTRHVGDGAPAWVLLEDLGDRIAISVRDEGDGIPEGRLDAARTEGRLGVSESIEGRLRDLGGTATLSTGPFGTEWEFVVPRRAGLE